MDVGPTGAAINRTRVAEVSVGQTLRENGNKGVPGEEVKMLYEASPLSMATLK